MGGAAGAAYAGEAVGAGWGAYASLQEGKAQKSYYGYLAGLAKQNASLALAQSESKKQDIGLEEGRQQIALTNKINETIGVQKAAMVSGVGSGSRSAQDIIEDTLDKGNLDEEALRLNAALGTKNADIEGRVGEMNYNTQAAGYKIAGMNAIAAARTGAVSSLLGAAGNVARSNYTAQMYSSRGNNTDSQISGSPGGYSSGAAIGSIA